jgi:protein TonB
MQRALPIVFRLPFALALGVAFTGVLFWSMWHLISQGGEYVQKTEAQRIEFTRMRRDTETTTKREEKVEREKPPPTPEIPQMALVSANVDSSVAMLNPTLDPRGALQGINIGAGGSDRDVIPLVRVNPDYPQRALRRNIEGWVVVQFTITPAGTVKDAKVVDAEPKGIFEDAALKAIARWRYNPKVVDGVAVERVGVQTLIRFELED